MVRNIRPARPDGGLASPGRRSFAVLAASAALPAWGQSYPWKPLQVVIPTPPGSGADILARLLAEPLRGRLGQPLIVESKSGATGTIAAAYVASAPPDGHTLLLTYGIQALQAAMLRGEHLLGAGVLSGAAVPLNQLALVALLLMTIALFMAALLLFQRQLKGT